MSRIIESNSQIFGGKPIVKGTRIPVELVFELFSLNITFDEIIEDYPSMSKEILTKLLEIPKLVKYGLINADSQKVERKKSPFTSYLSFDNHDSARKIIF